ncbi:MAG: hypothetical protein PCFJNLEI_02650 [Verrucomicrobiae bacterium]|nr:hypothetical protein [Verrucomicrobiae bacterium]
MALPRFRVTERQVLMALMGATVLAVASAILGSGFFTGSGQKLEPVTSANIRWGRDPEGIRQVLAEYFDPSLMSLPSPFGFSRGPWEHLAPPVASRYQPVIPAAFLGNPGPGLVPALLPPPVLATVVLAGLERPALPDLTEAAVQVNGPVITNSVIQLGGELAGRRLLHLPAIPLAPATLAVRRSLVMLAVDPAGRVQHAILERGCGSEALDTAAVELTRQLRFEPEASADALALTWGTARFSWAYAAGN